MLFHGVKVLFDSSLLLGEYLGFSCLQRVSFKKSLQLSSAGFLMCNQNGLCLWNVRENDSLDLSHFILPNTVMFVQMQIVVLNPRWDSSYIWAI